MNIAHWLARQAQIAPDQPALHLGTEPVADYGGFDRAARCFAAALSARGIAAGDRVALFMKNVPDYLIAQYGAWYAGAAVVPINAKLHPRETARILENAGASLCVTSPGLSDGLSDLTAVPLVETGGEGWDEMLAYTPTPEICFRAPDDLAWLFYTSGTTGRPKGVMMTHRMLMVMSDCYQSDIERVRPQDAAIYGAPLSHGAGIYNMMHVRAGARHVFPPSGGFDPAEVLDLAAHFGGVHMFMAPTMVQRLTRFAKEAGRDGQGLRSIIYAGGPMYNADIIEAVDHFGPVFAQIYGQGECPMGITALPHAFVSDRSHPHWRDRLGSVGRAQSAVELRIADEAGHDLPAGMVGEIMVRGDTVMPGYWQNPEATAKTLRDGWLWTGDMGMMDAEGFVTLKDRSRDMLISGGSNIYPREVEEALLEHPLVSEVAVIGRQHPEWGEEVVAFVVTNANVDEAALDDHCLARIARFKRPKTYLFVPELPKNNYGKVLKTSLREKLAASS
ncbi:Long-chain-fatty-acid--CoA ligase [Pelagimonas phthalicica]|uniref:3-methylmercaptopropionyl-CoA ligase n=1 Tax=Pelagimonas phthalicica TaxID=1037362 RepID=A0A238JJI6_9RHOB|nr:AMP-binding protein [Pelagimonas phthalicica]TDS90149.1 long-chain acyl-CoA synthetase [Pelagimonas phthalicica]SMX30317.1 Long-chain-fatty-acid--CoA ligase [Pelagimonas phthalicica]